ncbi:MAG: M23 family metallopeptidase [Clostridia bacterium]
MKRVLLLFAICIFIVVCLALFIASSFKYAEELEEYARFAEVGTDNIVKWVDFKASATLMRHAIEIDKETYGTDNHIDFIDLLAYTAAICGGEFDKSSEKKMDAFADRLRGGTYVKNLTGGMRYFKYYRTVYEAIFSEFLKLHEVERKKGSSSEFISVYDLAVYSPIAKGYNYAHYQDFHNQRTYGYNRLHMGNDLMGEEGTPIIAIEGGTIEALGWNEYGGWRIGIRSFDNMRYYYYAHLRKGHPYVKTLKVGDKVKAGDCIGYLGKTGCSKVEGTENLKRPHLHIGLELIFDESQKDGENQIWIDVYEIIELLAENCSEVQYNNTSGEFVRKYKSGEIGDT